MYSTVLSPTLEALGGTETGQQFECFFLLSSVSVCMWCVVGGPFLSLQCSLPAGGDDDQSPVLRSELGG